MNLEGFGQTVGTSCTGPGRGTCNNGLVCCGGTCVTPGTCAPGNPPPPGLVVPIDSQISFLLLSGVGLGIYFLVSIRKKQSA